jgi:hypothetical protein
MSDEYILLKEGVVNGKKNNNWVSKRRN